MTDDPIVQEVREARQAYAARFNCDLAAMVADLQHRTEEARCAGREMVRSRRARSSLNPRLPSKPSKHQRAEWYVPVEAAAAP